MISKRRKYLYIALSIPGAILFCLYVMVCFPLFVFTTLCSLSITFTRISIILIYHRLFGPKRA